MNQPAKPNRQPNSTPSSPSESGAKESFQHSGACVALPKGDGAIRGVGEEFTAKPLTGISSKIFLVAIHTGRSYSDRQLLIQPILAQQSTVQFRLEPFAFCNFAKR